MIHPYCFYFTVKYEAWLEDGTLVSKSNEIEFTVQDGMCSPISVIVSKASIFESCLTR